MTVDMQGGGEERREEERGRWAMAFLSPSLSFPLHNDALMTVAIKACIIYHVCLTGPE